MADSQTQENVREAIAKLTDTASYASRVGSENDTYPFRVPDIRTLLSAYTRMEADMAEARKLMNPFIEASENLDDTNDFDDDELWEHAAAMGLHVRDLRALAAFYNKGEE